jgi:uncharacterized protein with von Willebrand factor type A (vWA) domain
VKVTYEQLNLAEPALVKILYLPLSKKDKVAAEKGDPSIRPERREFASAKMSIRMGNLMRQVEPSLKQFEETRNGLVKKYGQENDKGGWSVESPEGVQAFLKELDEAGKEEVELACKPIPASWILEEGIKLDFVEGANIAPLVEED